jgi:glycosyltransferase involved in cell wall biosynthesis
MTNRPSCVHFVRELRAELGGVVTAVIDMCEQTAQAGRRVTLVTCDAKDAPPAWQTGDDCTPRVVEVAPSKLTAALLSRQAADAFTGLAEQSEVAHLHTPWELCNLQLASRLRRAAVPYVVSVHGMLDDYCMQQKSLKKRAFLALGGRRLFEHAAAIHFTAQGEMEQAVRYIPGRERAAVVPLAMNLAPYESLPGPELAFNAFPQIDRTARRILFLSRLHPKKGVDLLIRAAAAAQAKWPQFQLLLAGPGEDSYVAGLKALAVELGVSDRTHFLGMVQGEVKRSLYQASDVFVLPTHQENFGLVLPEALACGTPVVTTRGTDIWQELQQAGARIVDQQPAAIAAAIEGLLADPAEARQLGRRGREFVFQWLGRERIAAAYEAMYRDAAARGASLSLNTAARPQGEPLAAR